MIASSQSVINFLPCRPMRKYGCVFVLWMVMSTLAEAQILPTFGNSRTGGSGMQFLKVAPDARSLAMGGANVAVSNDLSSIYWNPAGITTMDTAQYYGMFSGTKYIGDVNSSYAAVGYKAGKLSFIALHVFAMNYGSMNETTELEPKGTGRTFSVSNYSIGLTYAKILTNNFSFGLNGKFANEGFAGVNINNFLFDLGLKYNVGVKNTRFGISFSNFGLNVSPSGTVSVLKFSGDQNISTYSNLTVPAIFRLGAAFDPISVGDHQVTISGQLNHPTDNNETYAIGGEYRYMGILSLRTGYEFKSDAAFVFPSVGFGLKLLKKFGGITMDYGFVAKNALGNMQRLTLAFHIR